MVVVDEILGRVEDTVIGADGREMVRFHGIFINIPWIVEAQVIQHEMTRFEIRLVTSCDPVNEDLELIRRRMQSQLGDIQLEINRVQQIERSPNGKFKAVISHVARGVAR
jgi:phenylacetate-CoA ligase